MQVVFIPLLLLLFWVVLIRPQRQRIAAQQSLLSGLEIGDEVITSGGLIGTIHDLAEREVALEMAPGVVVRVARMAVVGRTEPAGPGEFDDTDAALVDDDPAEGEQAGAPDDLTGPDGPEAAQSAEHHNAQHQTEAKELD
jgi:preprotein translocase subunit YajC